MKIRFRWSVLAAGLRASLSTSPATIKVTAADPLVQVMGRSRIEADGARTFGFPGVTFRVAVDGTHVLADMQSSSGQSWLGVRVDDGEWRRLQVGGRRVYELLHEPAGGHHVVELVHLSEMRHGQITLHGFHLQAGEFERPPEMPERKLLVLGDSVTCGEAIDREPNSTKSSLWWNARQSYGMLLADALAAQVHLVCWGGRGLVRTWDNRTSEPKLADFYEYAVGDKAEAARWDHQQYQPDLILSAIGTNDFGVGVPAAEHYVDAYLALLQKLRRNHSDALIVLTEGAILSGAAKTTLTGYLQTVVARSRDPRVCYVPSQHYPGDAQDAHPTKTQHQQMATDLAAELRQLMGW